MNRSEIRDFTKGEITKPLLAFALPLFLSNLLQVLYNMVDMAVVGENLGKVGTSAVAVGGDVSGLLTFIAMGFSAAGQVLIARYIGAGERHKLGRFIGTMCGFLLLASVFITGLGFLFQDKLLRLMNTPAESYEGAAAYASICMAGMIFIYGYNAISAIFRGMGDSKRPFLFIGVSAVLNLILDLILVPIPSLGAAGAAIATVISQAVSAILGVVYLIRNRHRYELTLKAADFVRWDGEMLGSFVKLGTPMAIKTASIQVSKLFVNAYINDYGVAVSAFAGIANKISSIANLVSAAMNTAGSTIVGQNIAAGEYARVKKVLLRLGMITVTVAALLSLLLCLFPTPIFSLFTNEGDGEVLALVPGYLPIAVLLFFGSALRAMMNALLNGSGNYGMNFVTAILDGIVMRIGLALLFGLGLNMAYYGFWLGDAIAGFTPFFIGLGFYISGRWKRSAKKTA